jgi:hypothetical protein
VPARDGSAQGRLIHWGLWSGRWESNNPNEPNKGVTTRFSGQLELNGVKSCEGWSCPDGYWKVEVLGMWNPFDEYGLSKCTSGGYGHSTHLIYCLAAHRGRETRSTRKFEILLKRPSCDGWSLPRAERILFSIGKS